MVDTARMMPSKSDSVKTLVWEEAVVWDMASGEYNNVICDMLDRRFMR
jgi:hypothetical protein